MVVGIHKPCFSLGQYTCEIGTGLINMLVSKKVDLVLHGHEHLYQRTHQLGLGAGCSALAPNTVVPACIKDSDATMSQNGTVFATVGTGGRPLRPVTETDSERGYFAAYSGQNVAPAFGILDVRATEDSLQGRFLRPSRGPSPMSSPSTAVGRGPTSRRRLLSQQPRPAYPPPSTPAPLLTPRPRSAPTPGTLGTARPAPESRPTTPIWPEVPTPSRWSSQTAAASPAPWRNRSQ